MNRNTSFQRVIAAALVIMTLAPLSASAETRRLSQTELTEIAAQVLNAILAARRAEPPAPPHPSRAPREEERRESTSQRQSPTSVEAGAVSVRGVVDAMNAERRQVGLAPLRLDSRLNAAAADRARDMFEKGYFDHVAPDGTQPFVWVRYRGYRYATVGENLAEGYRSGRGVVNGWMNSPGHRANLLGRSFEDVGVAIVRGSPTGRSNGYTFVALYAREATRRAISVASR
jgi:uncharacterized protein YkwD